MKRRFRIRPSGTLPGPAAVRRAAVPECLYIHDRLRRAGQAPSRIHAELAVLIPAAVKWI